MCRFPMAVYSSRQLGERASFGAKWLVASSFARRVGVTKVAIQTLEKSPAPNPELNTLLGLQKAFGLSLIELLFTDMDVLHSASAAVVEGPPATPEQAFDGPPGAPKERPGRAFTHPTPNRVEVTSFTYRI